MVKKGRLVDQLVISVMGWIITSIIGAIVGALVASHRKSSTKDAAMIQGMRAMMRQELIEIHRRYVIDRGICPILIKEHAAQVYEAYHALGGNGTGTQLYTEIQECHIDD